MDYFKKQLDLLKTERETDRKSYQQMTETSSVADRRANGLTWYPIAIRGSEMSRGDYLTVEAERTTHQDIPHQLRFGASAVYYFPIMIPSRIISKAPSPTRVATA
jgi:ATP-dependent RNA/DNA helicase IGHMBP2